MQRVILLSGTTNSNTSNTEALTDERIPTDHPQDQEREPCGGSSRLREIQRAYLATKLFSNDVVGELKSLLEADPEVHILRRATLGSAPGPKLRLDIEVGPARGRTTAGTIRVSAHSTHKDREAAWRAFEEAVEVLAAAGYERVDSGRGALTRGSGFFRPIAAPDE